MDGSEVKRHISTGFSTAGRQLVAGELCRACVPVPSDMVHQCLIRKITDLPSTWDPNGGVEPPWWHTPKIWVFNPKCKTLYYCLHQSWCSVISHQICIPWLPNLKKKITTDWFYFGPSSRKFFWCWWLLMPVRWINPWLWCNVPLKVVCFAQVCKVILQPMQDFCYINNFLKTLYLLMK
jgi:hypothetical protein